MCDSTGAPSNILTATTMSHECTTFNTERQASPTNDGIAGSNGMVMGIYV
jgi:hypothetical protein